MDNKNLTLHTIYELVKDDSHPTMRIVNPGEIIVRQNIPWDEIVNHLHDLEKEGLLTIKQLSIAAISITDKGIEWAISSGSVPAA